MGAFLVYVLKSAFCLAAFYLFYYLLLSRETFHRFNRMALLGLLVVSSVLPLVEVSTEHPLEVQHTMLSLEQLLAMADVTEAGETAVAESGFTISWAQGLLFVYLAGILILLGCNVCSLVSLWCLCRSCRREPMTAYLPADRSKAVLLVHDRSIAPFSWMHYIVVSQKDLDENAREILIHELAHIRNRHSIDLLVADLCIFVQWFNPAAWLLKRELQDIHEFEADEEVLRQGVDARNYQLLLIKKAVGTRLYSMANSLNHSKLKKRITMMKKEKSSKWACAKYLYILPLAAVSMVAFARPEIAGISNDISAVKVNDLVEVVKAGEAKISQNVLDEKVSVNGTVLDGQNGKPLSGALVMLKGGGDEVKTDAEGRFSLRVAVGDVLVVSFAGKQTVEIAVTDENRNPVIKLADKAVGSEKRTDESIVKTARKVMSQDEVDERPVFPGGDIGLMKFISSNLKYPAEALSAGIEGRVIITFVVEPDGAVSNIQVKKNPSDLLSEEAVRVMKMLPKWEPGKLDGKAVPVSYVVPVEFRNPSKKLSQSSSKTNLSQELKDALVYIDGKESDKSSLDTLYPENIKSITVFKGEDAIKRYGEKGKNGVLLVTTQQKKSSPVDFDDMKELVIINDKEADEATYKALDTNQIESVTVLKDAAAVKLYGERGRNGVILVKTKGYVPAEKTDAGK